MDILSNTDQLVGIIVGASTISGIAGSYFYKPWLMNKKALRLDFINEKWAPPFLKLENISDSIIEIISINQCDGIEAPKLRKFVGQENTNKERPWNGELKSIFEDKPQKEINFGRAIKLIPGDKEDIYFGVDGQAIVNVKWKKNFETKSHYSRSLLIGEIAEETRI